MAQNNKKYAYLNRLSTKQLEELLRMDIDIDELKLEDEAILFHILEVMEQRENENPASCIPDVDGAWKEFQEFYDVPEEIDTSLYPYKADCDDNYNSAVNLCLEFSTHKRSLPRWLKQGLVAVIAVSIVFGGMVVAQAAGIDVFGTIGRWTNEVFNFIPDENESRKPTDSNLDEHTPDYDILREKLSSVGIDDDLVPTWYPEGITFKEPKITTSSMTTTVTLDARGPDSLFVTVDFVKYASPQLLSEASFEKDSEEIEYYSNLTQNFYLLSNLDTITAIWSDGLVVQQITGNISRDDIKKIIDSIGEDIN